MEMVKELSTHNDIAPYDGVVPDRVLEDAKQSSPKRRRLVEKRVVKVPIKEMDEAHFNRKGEYCTNPPSDSWAWRKYGQKPIKGSPFPRGYYRCSSSKGCPARKQVERSQSDPSMLLIHYSYDHNHSFPVNSRNHAKNPVLSVPIVEEPQLKVEEKFADLACGGDLESMISTDDFAWALAEFDTSPNSRSISGFSAEFAGYFPMREEDDSLFADLGELPECSEAEERRRRYSVTAPAPWLRNTG